MSNLSDKVIPAGHGKIFGTDANFQEDLEKIKNALLTIKGVKDVIINTKIFPKEFTIHTSTLVEIKTIQDKVKNLGFHVIPKSMFQL